MRALCAATIFALAGCGGGEPDEVMRPTPFQLELSPAKVQVRCDQPPAVEALSFVASPSVRLDWEGRDYVGTVRFNLDLPQNEQLVLASAVGSPVRYSLERRLGDTWVGGWSTLIPAAYTQPLAVCVGGSVSGTLPIWGTTQAQVYQHFHVTPYQGEYRLVFTTDRLGADGLLVRLVSTPFQLN